MQHTRLSPDILGRVFGHMQWDSLATRDFCQVALASRELHLQVAPVMYRVVLLDSPLRVQQFRSTLVGPIYRRAHILDWRPVRLQLHVLHLGITGAHSDLDAQVVLACPYLISLLLPNPPPTAMGLSNLHGIFVWTEFFTKSSVDMTAVTVYGSGVKQMYTSDVLATHLENTDPQVLRVACSPAHLVRRDAFISQISAELLRRQSLRRVIVCFEVGSDSNPVRAGLLDAFMAALVGLNDERIFVHFHENTAESDLTTVWMRHALGVQNAWNIGTKLSDADANYRRFARLHAQRE